ncbi:hypothetical protein [Sphingomonas jaspsi]|uniref:hypothetical protein n=1 Tax=Sphingomonas jaspsi TaxID=392409 RepID=UPI0004BB2F63|nr:hypothetical protein [Sphingomonas jaspsi]
MPKFKVDVKSFIIVEVEAPDAAAARRCADDYVETGLSPTAMEIEAWNDQDREVGDTAIVIDASGGFCVDGYSETERICEKCSDFIDHGEGSDPYCFSCTPEPEEPPLDTPSLDDSFHRNEMDVD